jgi:KDO2-lipid IV(A) lauroyltransferase
MEAFPEPLSADLDTAVAQINRALEGLIRQCPEQYLWGYGRYKTPRPEP